MDVPAVCAFRAVAGGTVGRLTMVFAAALLETCSADVCARAVGEALADVFGGDGWDGRFGLGHWGEDRGVGVIAR